jgi:lysophospholipase L1-like esterase
MKRAVSRREMWVRAGLVILSIGVSLWVMESVSRLFGLDRIVEEIMLNSEADEPYGSRVKVDDPEIGWFLRGYDIGSEGLTISFPASRFYPRKKERGRYRILVLGDSIAEVWISRDPAQKFPQLLEQRLNRSSGGRRFEVINISVGSYDTVQRAAVLRKFLAGFEFDFLVIQHCFNDAVGHYVYRGMRQGKPAYVRYSLDMPGLKFFSGSGLLHSALFRALNLAAYNLLKGVRPDSVGIIGRFSVKQEEAYRWFRDYCAERRIELLVLMFPHLSDRSDSRFRWCHDQNDAAKSLLERLNINCYDLYRDFRVFGFALLRVDPADFTHPNYAGHRLAAQKLQDHLGVVPTRQHFDSHNRLD